MEKMSYYNDNEVDKIDLSKQKNNVHGEYVHDILAKAKETPAIAANFGNVLKVFEDAVEAETRAGFKDVSDSLAEKIRKELDPVRDRVETAFKAGLEAMAVDSDSQVSEAAKTMVSLVKKHKLYASLAIDAQTDAIRDFIADVEANHMDALRQSGMETMFVKLRDANNAVCDAQIDRDEAARNKVVNEMVEARKATDKAYRNLINCVNAFALVQGAADYADFITYANAVIRRYKRVYLGQTVSSPEAGPDDVVDGDEVVEAPGEELPGGDDNTEGGNDNNNGENNTTGGSIPTNPQPGDGDDPDL